MIGVYQIWEASRIRINGDRGYVTDWLNGLQVLDMHDPTRPTRLGSFAPADHAADIAVAGDLVLIAKQAVYSDTGQVDGGLQIVDVSTPSAPVLRGQYPFQSVNAVAVDGQLAYVASDGLYILDISDPAHPLELSHFYPANIDSVDAVQIAHTEDATIAYLLSNAGLLIMDVTHPTNPELVSSSSLGWYYTDNLLVVGNIAYIDGYVLDVSDPLHVTLLSILASSKGHCPNGCIDIVGNLVFLSPDGASGDLAIVDMGDPAHPKHVGSYSMVTPIQNVRVVDDLIYLANGYGGLSILRYGNAHIPPTDLITPAGGDFTSEDGRVTLQFPPDAVTAPVGISYTTLSAPTHPLNGSPQVLTSFAIEAYDSNNAPVTRFQRPYTIVISYTDAELAARGIAEASLNLAFWDGNAWIALLPCTGCGVDTTNNRLVARLDHFTEFVVTHQVLEQPIEHKRFLPLIRR